MSDIPTLGERRYLKSGDSTDWSPSELLGAMARDAGKFDGVVVCYFRRENGGTITGMRRSNTTIMEAVAMCEMAKWDLLRVDT